MCLGALEGLKWPCVGGSQGERPPLDGKWGWVGGGPPKVRGKDMKGNEQRALKGSKALEGLEAKPRHSLWLWECTGNQLRAVRKGSIWSVRQEK